MLGVLTDLGAVFGMEGLWHLNLLGYLDTGITACVPAVVLPLVMTRDRWRALAFSVALSWAGTGLSAPDQLGDGVVGGVWITAAARRSSASTV
ncbi:hypothetical protein SK854_06035 [Lentzea sp. BCCO 10_0061]|uniref:Uncharacterized protein n=1 Tax=Lentzea sokolovensis TaxID=3095429 RepID=A0ABU4UR71_9PSEU|nr:hypothetical protein [Lentzea sp. BCCO 10_0061]MDX8141662.1 hypothetical protein [Lentzea sp. BCCO 10_0061]